VEIGEKFSKNGKFKTKIRPDIWYWTVSNKGKIAPTTFLPLHMVEIKACWGAKYQENHNQEAVNTMKKVYWDAANKYQKAQTELEHHLKPNYDGFQIKVESNISVVSSLGAFNQFANVALENIMETKSKKTISIWGRRIVAEALKGSFDIWLKKNGWTSFVQKRSFNINREIAELDDDDLNTDEKRKDFITEMSQIALAHECSFGEVDLKG
jgi:small nuclear ribonucleoprotein (snRNP)-like protein